MIDTRQHWGAEELWNQLRSHLPDVSIEIAASVPSTNSALLERARASSAGADGLAGDAPARVRPSMESGAFGRRAADWQPCLLVAEEQTAGRGRMGRDWISQPLGSLTFSLALPMAPADWSGLSLAVGVLLANALDPLQAGSTPRIGIKWPNDLWLLDPDGEPGSGRKLGGILIETLSASAKRLAVIGIGLNIADSASQLSFQASSGFACLAELDPAATPPQTLARIALPLVLGLQQFEREGFKAFSEAFAARDLLRDCPIKTSQTDSALGVAKGVSEDGSLIVETAQGRRLLHSGEVSVRVDSKAARPTC